MQSETLVAGGLTTHFWRGGRGEPLILLPGGMADVAFHWSPAWDVLAERYEIFAPDLPGLGKSQAMRPASFPAYADWLRAFCRTLGVRRPRVAGVDFGASVGRAFSANHPLECAGLVMIGGGALPTILQRVLARVTPGERQPSPAQLFSAARLREMVNDPALVTDDFVSACQASSAIVTILNQAIPGPRARRRPQASTLVLWGENDRITPSAEARAMAQDMPTAAFRELRDLGHLPVIEAPGRTVEAMFAFLG